MSASLDDNSQSLRRSKRTPSKSKAVVGCYEGKWNYLELFEIISRKNKYISKELALQQNSFFKQRIVK